jgi:hypothetical protein
LQPVAQRSALASVRRAIASAAPTTALTSKCTGALASARSSWRRCATTRSIVRRLTEMLFSAASSWRTTSELPAWRRKRSPTHASNPFNAFGRTGGGGLRQAPSLSHRHAVVRGRPSSTALRRAHQPSDFSFDMAEKSSAPSSHRVQTLGLRQRFSR